MKCVIVLESVFSDNKLSFRCFDCSPRLSVGSGCELESARAHKNFDIVFDFGWQPAQIHIRVQLRLTGTSLCQCCRLPVKFQVPLAALPRYPHSGGQFRNFLSNIGKTVDITERKIKCLELQYFISEKKRSLSPHKKYVIHYFSFCNRLATSPGIERSFLCITHTKPKEPVPPRSIWI